MKYLYSLILILIAIPLTYYLINELKKNEPDPIASNFRLAVLILALIMSAILIPIYW